MSDRERFRRVEAIFHAALEQPAGEPRDALIRDACGPDESLRAEVALLLENDEKIRTAVLARGAGGG